MSLRIPLSLRFPAAALALGLAGAAHAADDDAGTEIIVTGHLPAAANPNADAAAPYKVDRSDSSKFSEPVADTPKSITIIPKEVIDDLGAKSFRDLVRTQPGITLGTGEGGNAFGDRIFIRGFDARNDVYIDGLRDPGVTSREIFAVEQIEIVKGPSSTFGGRGTTGGAVSLVSKAPQSRNFAIFEGTGGTDATARFTADLNRKLADTVQVRVNGLFHDADVGGTRPRPQPPLGRRRRAGVAARAEPRRHPRLLPPDRRRRARLGPPVRRADAAAVQGRSRQFLRRARPRFPRGPRRHRHHPDQVAARRMGAD